jgi:hypothetical protein
MERLLKRVKGAPEEVWTIRGSDARYVTVLDETFEVAAEDAEALLVHDEIFVEVVI